MYTLKLGTGIFGILQLIRICTASQGYLFKLNLGYPELLIVITLSIRARVNDNAITLGLVSVTLGLYRVPYFELTDSNLSPLCKDKYQDLIGGAPKRKSIGRKKKGVAKGLPSNFKSGKILL